MISWRKLKKIQYRPYLINGCLDATGLKIEPWVIPCTTSALCGFPGLLLSRWPLRACCHRRGSAAAAHSRATDPATTRAEPAAILGLRRCTARATRRT